MHAYVVGGVDTDDGKGHYLYGCKEHNTGLFDSNIHELLKDA
jgi:hypothetical protein